MHQNNLQAILEQIASGEMPLATAQQLLTLHPCEQLDHTTIDYHRLQRQGIPEVIWGNDKSAEQINDIAQAMVQQNCPVLITRAQAQHLEPLKQWTHKAIFHRLARMITIDQQPSAYPGDIAIVSAGTSDQQVAAEAQVTAEFLGHRVTRYNDIGVAGLHRLTQHLPNLRKHEVLIVVAGMEGALPSVVAGLLATPVIAVPTSIGYGASFQGMAALLGMLNSCANGVTVVNIDNGFGAATAAHRIFMSRHQQQDSNA